MAKQSKPVSRFKPLQLMIPSWAAGDSNDAAPITGVIEKAVTITIEGEARRALHFRLTEESTDGDGVVHMPGDLILVWQNAALYGLENHEGSEVRITPKGFGERSGKKSAPRLFDVEIAE